MESKLRLISIVLVVSGLCFLLMSASYVYFGKDDVKKEIPSSEEIITDEVPPLAPQEDRKTTVTFAGAGDNLIHDNIYTQAANRAGGEGFDFDMPYAAVEKLIKGHDIAFINQESPIAERIAPLSGYPRFNSPEAVGKKIADMGFNLIGISNNHMFDKGEEGLLAHMDFWDEQDILLCMGAWRHEEDMEKPILLEVNEITFGFIPMTEHTNGLDAKKGSDIRYIRTDEWDLIEKQLSLINEKADFQVASIHWGIENSLDASENQRALAKRLSDEGIDLIIGCHSHTLQPVEWIEREDGTRTLVIYSLGNFISSMLDQQNMLGGIMDLVIEKNHTTGETYIKRARIHPIVTQYEGKGRRDVRIIPFSEYTEELAQKHGVRINYPGFSLDYLNSIIDKNIPDEFMRDIPLNPS